MKAAADEIDYLTSLEKIISAYEEIAAKRMQNIKAMVLQNRKFLTELNQIFQIVKSNYQKEAARHKIRSLDEKKRKTARVFISANAGLYGDIIQRIFTAFHYDYQRSPSDIVIIGQSGKTLMEKNSPKTHFTYFDYPDAKFDKSAAKKLVDHLIAYKTVIVYHGLFKNILMQETSSTNITGDKLLPEAKAASKRRLIFEPSLSGVLTFFETEFFSSLLVQTIYEAQLAKFSARMASLNQAGERIKEAHQQAGWEYNREKHRLANKKQLGTFASISLWS